MDETQEQDTQEVQAVKKPSLMARMASGIGSGLAGLITPSEEPTGQPQGEDTMADLFEGPKSTDHDMVIDHLVSVDDEDIYGEGGEDMSDILDVDDEDIMGEAPEPETPPKPKVRTLKLVRTNKPYPPQLTGIQ